MTDEERQVFICLHFYSIYLFVMKSSSFEPRG